MNKSHHIAPLLVILVLGGLALAPVVARASGPLVGFGGVGSGTTTSTQTAQGTLGAPCDDVHDCSVSWSGTFRGRHVGQKPFQGSVTVLWSHSTSNGTSNGVCAPAQGTGTVTAANGDQLDLTLVGAECETGALSPSSPHTFNGSYFISGGTGRFSNLAGSGNFVASDAGIEQSGNSAGTGNLLLSAFGAVQL